MRRNRAILLTGLLLVLVFVLFEATPLDLAVQDCFYDSAHGWVVNRQAPMPRFFFYDAPKLIFAVLIAVLLGCLVVPTAWFPRRPFSRCAAAFLLVCFGLVPGTVGLLKATTGVFFPYQVERYGGKQPYRNVLQSIPHVPCRARGKGFPAGHASGGFALMGLYFAWQRRQARWLGLASGLVLGWTLGLYQMLKGAHYLSHTVVTMVLGWLIILLLARLFRLDAPAVGAPAGNASVKSGA
jgi:membrane-associated PAP2 superfamily phosphatase